MTGKPEFAGCYAASFPFLLLMQGCWLHLFATYKQYYYYSEKTVNKFKILYNKGYGEKEILDKIQGLGIKTRAEIKAIEDLLVKYNRIDKREVSVKEYRDKQRFN